jgi:hypothetical protein
MMSATPLLDREQTLPQVKRRRWAMLLGLAIGALLGMAIARAGFLVIPAIYVSILVHELGHVIAGKAAGFELRGLAVGGIVLNKQARGWRLRFALRRIFSGFTKMLPPSTESLRGRYAQLVAGGPAASILLLLITPTLPAGEFVRVLFFVNLVATVSCLIPYAVGGMLNDAKFLTILARKGAAAEQLAAILYLLAIDAQGTRPSAWPLQIVERLGVPGQGTPLIGVSLALKYAVASDSEDAEGIAHALENGLASAGQMPPDTQRWFLASAACFDASFRNRTAPAEQWLESARKVKSAVSQKGWDSKAVALIALAKGDFPGARDSLTSYLAYIDRQPRPLCGMLVAERARTVARLDETLKATA